MGDQLKATRSRDGRLARGDTFVAAIIGGALIGAAGGLGWAILGGLVGLLIAQGDQS